MTETEPEAMTEPQTDEGPQDPETPVGEPHDHLCSRCAVEQRTERATVERADVWYCGRHDPGEPDAEDDSA